VKSDLDELVDHALGRESAELARMYLGEGAVTRMAVAAEQLASAQAGVNGRSEAAFRVEFGIQLKLLLNLATGGRPEAPGMKE
jgi:hypothetical protein